MDVPANRSYQAVMATFVQPFGFRAPGRRSVGLWLLAMALLIAAMVIVGGVTRLTGSGLSITQWHPITGIIPPLSDQAWQSEFARYRHIPQYKLENRGMGLVDFRAIYWWEWTHRLLGRLIGFAFLLPLVYFIAVRAIPREGISRLVLLFALGGLQGFVGWWMVESGLEARVSVSQYRLAIHLGVALILFGAILWTALQYLREPHHCRTTPIRSSGILSDKVAFSFLALVYLQMLLGALVAGLHAGLIYNTWPSMNGHFAPEGGFSLQPWWINVFENPGLAQFDHRMGAYLVAGGAFWLWSRSGKQAGYVRTSANAILAVTALQIMLGIATLLNQAPVALAGLHQATAVALLSAALWHAFELTQDPQAVASA